MRYEYDLITIGLGPAGMAVSIMASEMGLKVCGIESNKIGGECMNVGCIPSKALLRIAKARALFKKLDELELSVEKQPVVKAPFEMIQKDLRYINEKKTLSMFDKVELILRQGQASFIDPHTIEVGQRKITAQHIFICVGSRPYIPDFPGVDSIDILTNENVFNLSKIPQSLLVIGGGAIACEMAQAFARLGSKVTIAYRGDRLLRNEDPEASKLLETAFRQDGVEMLFGCSPKSFHRDKGQVVMEDGAGKQILAERVLMALGRRMSLDGLNLQNAGVEFSEKGIKVDRFLRTSQKHIFGVGDCNGYHQFSHAAMHQGMIALMNCMLPHLFKFDFRKYVVPATIFTDPQVSYVGKRAADLEREGVAFEAVQARYEDYGAAIAEKIALGFVKAFIGRTGKIYGATVVGEGSADMINEWGLAIQNKMRIDKLLFLQHSFPSMSFLNKRVAEGWMMNRMRASSLMRKACQFIFRI